MLLANISLHNFTLNIINSHNKIYHVCNIVFDPISVPMSNNSQERIYSLFVSINVWIKFQF